METDSPLACRVRASESPSVRPAAIRSRSLSPWCGALLCLLAVQAGRLFAAETEVDDPEDDASAGTSGGALSNPAAYALQADDAEGRRAELLAQIKTRHPAWARLPPGAIALDRLAERLLGWVAQPAGGFKPRDAAQRTIDVETVSVAYALLNLYGVVEQALLTSRLPADFRTALQHFHADEIIGRRTTGRDAKGMAQDIAAIPAGWEAVKVADAPGLAAEMERRCPALAALGGPARKHALDWIAAVNPCLRGAGFRMAPADQAAETGIHAVLPAEGGRVRVALYEFVPGFDQALLPGPEGLKGLPAHGPNEAWDCALPVITGAASPRRVVLALRPAGDSVSLMSFCTLVLEAPAGDGAIGRGYARLDPLSNLPQRLIPALSLRGGQLAGAADLRVRFDDRGAFDRWIIRLDAAARDARVAGTFTASGPPLRAGASRPAVEGTVAGLILSGGDLDDPARRATADQALRELGAAPAGGTPIAAEYPRPLGPIGSGEAPPCGQAMVEGTAQARLLWRSEQETPGSYFDAGGRTPGHWFGVQGGYAAPMIAHGAVYATYFWPPDDDVFDPGYLAAHSNLPLNANNSYYYPDGPFPRQVLARKSAVWADDVVLCLDGATGRTRWKASFVHKGYNHGFQGRGAMISTKTGPVTEATIAGGRLYHLGSSGRVYCLDARTGELQWESSIGWRHDEMEHRKRGRRRNRQPAGSSYDLCSSPAVIGGVVVLNDHTEYKGGQRSRRCGLVALETASGRTAWTRPELCGGWLTVSPLRWTHADREFAITHSEGTIYCLDAQTGRTVWELKGYDYGHKTVLDADHLVLNQGGAPVCYRINPQGASLLWRFPRALDVGTAAIVGKRLFFTGATAVCLDLETGSELGGAPGSKLMSHPASMDDRVFCEAAMTGLLGIRMYRVGGAPGLELLGTLNIPVANCVAPAVADGRLVVRTLDAVCCYELRREHAPVVADPAPLVRAARSSDGKLAAAAVAACALLGDRAVPAAAAALEAAFKAGDTAEFLRATDAAAAAGTNGMARLAAVLAAALAGPDRKAALLVCELAARVWPRVTAPAARTRLIRALADAAKEPDIALAVAALRTLGAFGPAAACVAAELRTEVGQDLAAEVGAALEKIEAVEPAAPKPRTAPNAARPKDALPPPPSL